MAIDPKRDLASRLPGESEESAKRRVFKERLGEHVLTHVPNASGDNLRHLQVYMARTKLGDHATRLAKRTESLLRRATTKAVDMTSIEQQERFFAGLTKLTEQLRLKFVAIGRAQDGIAKAEVELQREYDDYDRLLGEMGQLIRPGARLAEETSPARAPTRRAAVVTPQAKPEAESAKAEPAPVGPGDSPPAGA